ncbi:MAG: nucleoside phosphorylase [Geminicoccaceae bacterium]
MIGVVTGLVAEARCLHQGHNRFICTGGSSARARSGALRLVKQDVCALCSFGLAGGLHPDLASGSLLLPEHVLLPDGGRIGTDAVWRERLAYLALAAGLKPLPMAITGSDDLVATPDAKAALYRESGAAAVDMESHAVGEVAKAAKLPFVVVRVIADTHDEAIPEAARHGLGPEGQIKPLAVLMELMRRPKETSSLIRLGRESGKALGALRRVANLAPDLAFV